MTKIRNPQSAIRNPQSRVSRRELLRAGAFGTMTAALGSEGLTAWAQWPQEHGPYWPFRMGIQSYSLRGFNFDEALEKTVKFGLHYWEAFQSHIPLTDSPRKIQETLAKLKAAQVLLWAWGVQGFDGSEANARRTFEFAKTMGIRVISADPSKEALPILDKLVEVYKRHNIYIAIHNHGPGSRYDKIADVANAIRGHHPRIGACVDTGHYLRSGEDPVEAVKTFGKRTYDIHLKDVKNRTQFTEIGQGDLNTVQLLKTLRRLDYQNILALEYEEHEDNPATYIDLCLSATRDAISKAMNQR